ncbi:cytosolic phospholipase A2 epsilon-like isoform X1 [Gopherus flavomarginatus]|uniref:cytosolic phospholipase A2 epsilon-like isoform X1 n=1 Tax=Gopherus flavomarginatus TaxID=286002 RepID=UPI0021CB9ABE|nr:cytosolic phospholipase A2 epsilon-like isoform X1 [Gopherus flavomarginatus]
MFQESLPAVEPSTPVPLIAPHLNVAETTMESPAGFHEDLNSNPDPLGNVGTKWMKQRAVQWDADYKEASLCYLLTVRIIRMRNLPQRDFLSQSNCYVSLWLPTASAERVRTKTIKNCRDPLWNETFYFRIQSQVKNVLELAIFDEDIVQDDGHFIVLFDIAKIPLGETIFMKFQLNPQRREELEAQFTLENLLDLPETIITNGVVVSREMSCLEVQVNRRRWKKKKKTHSTKHDLTFTVKGSFEETHSLSLCCDPSFHLTEPILFHYAKHSQPQLDITVPKMKTLPSFCACMSCRAGRSRNGPLTVPLNLLPFDQEVIDKHRKFDLCFKTKQCREDLDVRLGFELCVEEQDFLRKRKKVVAASLKKVLQLEEDLQDDEVPVVAFMTTGGGTRALTAMYAHLLSIQKLNVLDCISYVTGLSGTTWTMSNLYEDPDWSQKDMEASVSDARKHVIKNKFLACFSMDRLKYYVKELQQRKQEGHKICFTDLWGLIIEAMLHDGEDQHKLTDQQQALSRGQNPLPIYLVLNVKDKISNQDFREWMEFTPYEVGLLKYGAFIRAENFGSEFFMGRLMKKLPESRICFLEGIWSSVFSLNLMDAWYISFESEEFWHKWTQDRVIDIEEEPVLPTRPSTLTTRVVSPPDSLSTVFRDVLMLRPAVSEIHNFLKGCQMHNNYLENEFSRWKDCELDCHPNQLTGAADHLALVDTAFAFETSYPPLMRPERKVDLILHFNYSSGSQIAPLIKASKYFSEQGIPFPKIVPGEEEAKSPKECYIVGDKEGPETPVVLLFPLVNDTFRNYKAPGVKRSPSEMAEGEIDVANINGSYNINNLRYSEEDFDKLAKLSYYNVQNNKDLILQALRIAVERKKQHRNSLKPHTLL